MQDANTKTKGSQATVEGSDASQSPAPAPQEQEVRDASQVSQAKAEEQTQQEASTPAETSAEKSAPPACEVKYKRNDKGGFDLWIGEGCSQADLASISKGKAQVSNITLECYERWKEQYGQSEPGAEEGQGDGADLSSELSEVERLLKRVVTEKMEFIVEPEIPEEEALAKTAAKKKKK